MQSLSCGSCGAPLEPSDEPTLRCNHCGTVMINPFYQAPDRSGSAPLLPQININITNTVVPTAQSQEAVQGQPYPAGADTLPSSKNWYIATGLCLFLGVFGVHRFYTGNLIIGAIQLVTMGVGGLWTLIDFLLLLTGHYVDGDGNRLSPPWRRQLGLGTQIALVVGLLLLGCVICGVIGALSPSSEGALIVQTAVP